MTQHHTINDCVADLYGFIAAHEYPMQVSLTRIRNTGKKLGYNYKTIESAVADITLSGNMHIERTDNDIFYVIK